MKKIEFKDESINININERSRARVPNTISHIEKIWDNKHALMYSGPIIFSSSVSNEEKINYYKKFKSQAQDKGDKKRLTLKTREIESWITKVKKATISLDNIALTSRVDNIRGGRGERSRERSRYPEIDFLDAIGAHYDGMNLIYILFYNKDEHALFISAYDISDKEFYQFTCLGYLYEKGKNDKSSLKYPNEGVCSASSFSCKDNKIYWYVQGTISNIWIAEHDAINFEGSVKHYVSFKDHIGRHIEQATLLAINGSAYLAAVQTSKECRTTLFCTDNITANHWVCLNKSRNKPLVCLLGENIYHIGGIENKDQPFVEIHTIYLKDTCNNVHQYHPTQRMHWPRNTFLHPDIENINVNNSIYVQCDNNVYIFKDKLFNENEEYIVYSLLENNCEILRLPEDVAPPFDIDSKLAVKVGKQIYLFLFNSEKGELSYKIINRN